MYLKVFVGPYAPLEQCGPEEAVSPPSSTVSRRGGKV